LPSFSLSLPQVMYKAISDAFLGFLLTLLTQHLPAASIAGCAYKRLVPCLVPQR
jgi:hypothetical protein